MIVELGRLLEGAKSASGGAMVVDTDTMKLRSKCTSLHAVDGWPIERDESDCFVEMCRVLCFPIALSSLERLWGEKWESPPFLKDHSAGARIPVEIYGGWRPTWRFSASQPS